MQLQIRGDRHTITSYKSSFNAFEGKTKREILAHVMARYTCRTKVLSKVGCRAVMIYEYFISLINMRDLSFKYFQIVYVRVSIRQKSRDVL